MNVARRTKKLKALLEIRNGPGAAIFPKEIKRIHLEFAYRLEGGHFGPRKFWRQCMPSLKYHNPAVSMTVNRSEDQKAPATITIFTASSSRTDSPRSSSLTDRPTDASEHETSRVEMIDMKHKHENAILRELMDVTKAQPREIPGRDHEESQEVKGFEARSQKDRDRQGRLNQRRAEEEKMLEQARGVVS